MNTAGCSSAHQSPPIPRLLPLCFLTPAAVPWGFLPGHMVGRKHGRVSWPGSRLQPKTGKELAWNSGCLAPGAAGRHGIQRVQSCPRGWVPVRSGPPSPTPLLASSPFPPGFPIPSWCFLVSPPKLNSSLETISQGRLLGESSQDSHYHRKISSLYLLQFEYLYVLNCTPILEKYILRKRR